MRQKLTQEEINNILNLYQEGKRVGTISRLINRPIRTIYNFIETHNISKPLLQEEKKKRISKKGYDGTPNEKEVRKAEQKRRNKERREYFKQYPEARKNHYQKHGRKMWLKYTYGISLEEYQNKYNKQMGRCIICGKSYEVLCVDHSHQTDQVRGLLCGNCNRGLGLFYDNVELLKSAICYLDSYKEIL